MTGFQSKKMMARSRDPGEPIQEYAEALLDATLAIDQGNATPQQNLIWLQALSEMWVRQSRSEVSTH
jgi:hypothetical protein